MNKYTNCVTRNRQCSKYVAHIKRTFIPLEQKRIYKDKIKKQQQRGRERKERRKHKSQTYRGLKQISLHVILNSVLNPNPGILPDLPTKRHKAPGDIYFFFIGSS